MCGSEDGMFCKTIDCLLYGEQEGRGEELGQDLAGCMCQDETVPGCGSGRERDAGSAVEISY